MIVDAEKAFTIYLQKTYQHMVPEERCGRARWKVERDTHTHRVREREGDRFRRSDVEELDSGGGTERRW